MTHEENCPGGICDCDNPVPIYRPVTPHDKLLEKFTDYELYFDQVRDEEKVFAMLRAVVELHKPFMGNTLELCKECSQLRKVDDPVIIYPCPTIQAIEKELK